MFILFIITFGYHAHLLATSDNTATEDFSMDLPHPKFGVTISDVVVSPQKEIKNEVSEEVRGKYAVHHRFA